MTRLHSGIAFLILSAAFGQACRGGDSEASCIANAAGAAADDVATRAEGLLDELARECAAYEGEERRILDAVREEFAIRVRGEMADWRAIRRRAQGLWERCFTRPGARKFDFERLEAICLAMDNLECELRVECARLRRAIRILRRERAGASCESGPDTALIAAECEMEAADERSRLRRADSKRDGISGLRSLQWHGQLTLEEQPWSIYVHYMGLPR